MHATGDYQTAIVAPSIRPTSPPHLHLDRLAEHLAGRHAHRFARERLVERLREVLDAHLRRLVELVVDAAAVEDLALLVADERLAGPFGGELLRDGGVDVVQERAAELLLLVELALVGRRLALV